MYCVIDMRTKEKIIEERYEGIGSCPIIAYRWSKASGEIYGRGPLINALSAIKTTNLTVELILENAQMAISGICLLYTSPSPRDLSTSRMPSSA